MKQFEVLRSGFLSVANVTSMILNHRQRKKGCLLTYLGTERCPRVLSGSNKDALTKASEHEFLDLPWSKFG